MIFCSIFFLLSNNYNSSCYAQYKANIWFIAYYIQVYYMYHLQNKNSGYPVYIE